MTSLTRRHFLKLAWSAALGGTALPALAASRWVNDIHSGLNPTRVSKIVRLNSVAQLKELVRQTAMERGALAVCGARHAGGGQQFLSDHMLVDLTSMNRPLSFDKEDGRLTVQPGMRWSEVLRYLHQGEAGHHIWCVRQRPTGNDRLTVGGTLSANAHGQGLGFPPLIAEVERLELIEASGNVLSLSRQDNADLFSLAIGGYGLFGLMGSITLKLVPARKMRCVAEQVKVKDIPNWHGQAVHAGAHYGSVQVNVDEKSPDFLLAGIANKYLPVDDDEPVKRGHGLTSENWLNLVSTAHEDMGSAWQAFSRLQLESSGEVDWSFRWHTSPYVEGYHKLIDRRARRQFQSSEILTELYVPMACLAAFMADAKSEILQCRTKILYSTVRFIAADKESFLPWARQSYACVIFNLHAEHSPHAIAAAACALRGLIDCAIKYDGSYYLTYHRFASRNQVLACYKQFPLFLAEKLRRDPGEVFQSDWYHHYKRLFG